MDTITFEVLMILLLVMLNGLFAMAEFAIIASRKSRLQELARQGNHGAEAALKLSRDPSAFLSTVQIGITLVGVLAGAFGGATLAQNIAVGLQNIPLLSRYSGELAFGAVVIAITFLSLVIGELAPKRVALNHPERLATILAPLMKRLASLVSPLVLVLGKTTNFLLSLLGQETPQETPVTEEEIRTLIAQASQTGEMVEAEVNMVEGVFRLGDRRIGSLMTPRTDIEWLNLSEQPEENRYKVSSGKHSSYPVAHDDLDNVVGLVAVKDLLGCCLDGKEFNLEDCLLPAVFIPENTAALDALKIFKSTEAKLALVIDEYGGVQGLMTVRDILESIIGEYPIPGQGKEARICQRKDGSWLVDGTTPVDEFMDAFHISELPDYSRGHYETMGGFVLSQMGKIPSTGEEFKWGRLQFEILDMDGLRVDKILVKAADEEP